MSTTDPTNTTVLPARLLPAAATSETDILVASKPTAPASTSAYAMQGLAGSIKPTTSGTVLLTVTGTFIAATTTAGDGIQVQLSYGTGTAPANAAALTGTQVGPIVVNKNPTTVTAADVAVPFQVSAVVTGLTLGTTYWIDLAAESVGTISSGGIGGVSVVAVELR